MQAPNQMHVVEKTSGTASVAEKRHMFEQLSGAKRGGQISQPEQNGNNRPPPKPARTFVHDQYLTGTGTGITEGPTVANDRGSGTTQGKVKPVIVKRHNRVKEPIKPRPTRNVQGVSHEYEHIFADRTPTVLRHQRLRRSLSDDPLVYAESAHLKMLTTDMNVSPIFYASSPVPSASVAAEDNSIYDTPAIKVNGYNSNPTTKLSKLQRRRDDWRASNRSEERENEAENENVFISSSSTEKRVNRARMMRRRTLMHYDQQEIAFVKRRSPQLFEFAALVRLDPNDGSNPMLSSDQKYAPTICYRFPPVVGKEKNSESLMASLSCLCYPDISKAVLTSPDTYKDEQFLVTITDQFGDRKFAYCYRFVPVTKVMEKAPTGKGVRIIGQNSCSSFYTNETVLRGLPQVLCVVTPVQAPNFYADFVREAAMRVKHASSGLNSQLDDLCELNEFLKAAFGKALPCAGGRLVVSGSWGRDVTVPHRLSSSRGTAPGLAAFMERVGFDHTLLLFTSLLSERRILLVGDSVPAVSKAVQAAAAILSPFEWPHTLVPVVPDPYVNLCFSPTPYLMGLLRNNLHLLKDLLVGPGRTAGGSQSSDDADEECLLILDLDYGILKDKDFDTATAIHRCLPMRTTKILKHNIRGGLSSSGDCTPAASISLADTKDAKVADAFLTAFVDLIGHYGEFMVTQQDGQVAFQKQQFVNAAVTESQRSFLRWFVETGMFQVWLKKKLDPASMAGREKGKNVAWNAITASDGFDRKLELMKLRQTHANAAYRVLMNIRRLSSLLRRKK